MTYTLIEQLSDRAWILIMILPVAAVIISAAVDPDNRKKEGKPYDPDRDYFGL